MEYVRLLLALYGVADLLRRFQHLGRESSCWVVDIKVGEMTNVGGLGLFVRLCRNELTILTDGDQTLVPCARLMGMLHQE